MKPLISFLWLMLAFAPLTSQAQGLDEENPCGTFKTEIPKDWTQGTVIVPENPDDLDGKKIKVFYYGKVQPNKTPVVFFNGGPGQHSHDAFYLLSRGKNTFDPKNDLSFVFIDQRGTGCSDFYPQGSSEEILERLIYYGSRGIVADSEAVRKALIGNKPWIIFGQSYGAHIVHKYVTLYPKSVKAAFAHGNTINSNPFDRFKFRIASQVRVLNEYLRQYPEDVAAIEELTFGLKLSMCFNYGKLDRQTACGFEISQDIMSSFLGSSNNWFKMHQWLNIVVDENGLNHDGLAFYVKTFFEEPSEKYSTRWADRVIGWVDRNTAPYDLRHCKAAGLELFLDDVDIQENAFNECASILQDPESNLDSYGRKMVKFLPQDILTIKDFNRALVENSQINFYLYSGQKDPFVPVESYQDELSVVGALPNLHYKNFLGTGHDGYQTEAQVWRELIREALKP